MTVQKQFDLENYLTTGVENIVKGAIKATLKDPKESAFMGFFCCCQQERGQPPQTVGG